MKLKHLIKNIEGIEVRGSKEIEITGLTSDSRRISPGNLFIAKKGYSYDGSHFIQNAIEGGAAAVVSDVYDPFINKTQVIVANPSEIQAKLAASYYQQPAKELRITGITGSKGKTTTSYLSHYLLNQLGSCAGLMSTVETILPKAKFYSSLTTHDSITNQKMLREMVAQGCQDAVMEVSSHGLDQGRVEEIQFDTAIFTNLYPDHLDYHGTLERYALAKRKLFEQASFVILNQDSPWSESMRCGKDGLTYGLSEKSDVRATDVQMSAQGLKGFFWFRGKKTFFESALMGFYNVYNLLGVVTLGLHLGHDLEILSQNLSRFRSVPGRLEPIDNSKGFHVFVDYAHTGEALRNVLETLKKTAQGKLFVLFGCGGNRDPSRRTTMAQAAEQFADGVVVTNDNPRNEDPLEIIRQILNGFEDSSKVLVEPDRALAIQKIIGMARRNDTILIAGKGHEKVQIFSHQTVLFDDVKQVQLALAEK